MSHYSEHQKHELLHELRSMKERLLIMASALDNLTAATVKLTSSVDAAVTEISTPHATDAQVQAAADAITSQAARLDTAVAAATASTVPPTA